MKPGDIVLIDFPFTTFDKSKVRPAVVIALTRDKYRDIVICAISSVVSKKIAHREILIKKNDDAFSASGLRVNSVVKIDRIATVRRQDVINQIGKCTPELWQKIVDEFRNLIKNPE